MAMTPDTINFELQRIVLAVKNRIRLAGQPTPKTAVYEALQAFLTEVGKVINQVQPRTRREAVKLQCQTISHIANELLNSADEEKKASPTIANITPLIDTISEMLLLLSTTQQPAVNAAPRASDPASPTVRLTAQPAHPAAAVPAARQTSVDVDPGVNSLGYIRGV